MTRSRRRTPITGMTCAESDKEAKRKANRQARRALKSRRLDVEDPPDKRKFGSPWNAPKDGKQFFNPEDHPDMMRK